MMAGLLTTSPKTNAQAMIGPNNLNLQSDLMTPEALWGMGRIGASSASPNGKQIVYQVSYYNVEQNKSHTMLFVQNVNGKNRVQLTQDTKNESDAVWIEGGRKIAFLRGGEIWTMTPEGKDRRQLTKTNGSIEGFVFSPDGSKVIMIKSIPYHGTIRETPVDLPKATGRLITDMNYRHWDHYVETIAHPFVANVTPDGISNEKDIMAGEPYESPVAPFGGIEQMAWSTDSKRIAYTSRKKEGLQYAISTDTDIYLYDLTTGKTVNLCKPADYTAPQVNATKTMRNQQVNLQKGDMQVGYDLNPKFSPDGRFIAWQSMAHDGYESDLNRLCIMELSTGKKQYLVNKNNFDSNVDDYVWANDSKSVYFLGCWHACVNVYQATLDGKVLQLTDGWYDYGSIKPLGNTKNLLVSRHSMLQPDDLYLLTLSKTEKKSKLVPLTFENEHILDQLAMPKLQQRWVKTTDGKEELVWIVLPPHFDANKKYPTLLFCEGGPQSPVSQFWSYRWNFFIMAAHGYVVVAPNRRGLPGFGSEWNEAVSGNWTGQCMDDYLSAIDDAANNLPFVDKDRLGCIGASFGGFSVYYLAGHHNKRFKAFIAHDGAFNLESMYTDTEEAWFSNWEYDDAYWNKDQSERAKRTYENSPHRFVDKWDTPILIIHGEKDYRINANQGMGAFNAARMRGIPAELLLFPDENHWVLKPQNGILWQRTFFNWLDKWLKQ